MSSCLAHASHEPVNKKELMIVMYTSLIYCAKAIGLAIKFMCNISMFRKSRFESYLFCFQLGYSTLR